MSMKVRAGPAEVSERVIRFIAAEVQSPGTRTRLVTTLGTDYKRLNRFCTLGAGERPIRDVAYMLEILGALGYNAADVFSAAVASATSEDMRLYLRHPVEAGRTLHAATSEIGPPLTEPALRPTG